mmetsp:Transcript_11813/g.24918  ORF Transcript_11813/g.24918 Transcript_11813/m.24918 type:complete len:316 (+) Transcript_11813:72-1019(+)
MKSILAIAATLAAYATPVNAFVTPRSSAFLGANVMEVPSTAMPIDSTTRTHSKLLPIDDSGEMESSPSWRKRTLGKIKAEAIGVWERMDTLNSAGFYEDGELAPLQAGFKSNVALLVAAFLFKWYRARYITKIPVWDRQPQWNMVITSPEQEKTLKAYKCKKCGAIIFIARHREWFFKGGNSECTNCGATGKDNFENVRDEVVDSIDDDYFDYESPLDFVSAAERRKLVKEAGGDEELAKKLAIDRAMENDSDQIRVEDDGEGVGSGEVEKKKKKKKNKSSSSGNEKSSEKKEDPPNPKKIVADDDDIFDELDMD